MHMFVLFFVARFEQISKIISIEPIENEKILAGASCWENALAVQMRPKHEAFDTPNESSVAILGALLVTKQAGRVPQHG